MAHNRLLFNPTDLPEITSTKPSHKFSSLTYPLWTEHKARLIARYLYYFVMITKHGTYIDGFAGPQNEHPEMWAAKLVIEMEPRWLRNFYLFELDHHKISMLEELRDADRRRLSRPRRAVHVYHGDFNANVQTILDTRSIKPKEATFCLLDQRTFECHWSTVKRLAAYKPAGQHKIELFYFLPIGWLDRALAATKDEGALVAWWGSENWYVLRGMNRAQRAQAFADRFRGELGYMSVVPWPIYENQVSERVMYYMIHATDHPEAPKLMRRAYARAVDPLEPIEQLELDWEAGLF